jgi:hypothetical protein
MFGMLYPKHFWASATHDPSSILGCPPISCYRGTPTHPDGFASHIEMARNHLTHASSSTATDDNFASTHYDAIINVASSGMDSRMVSRSGFVVDNKSPTGVKLGDGDESNLEECVESSQMVMNLAAAAVRHPFDVFFTFTCSQKNFPGLGCFHRWKESMKWTDVVENWDSLMQFERNDVIRSMEMMYTNVISRCWFEVKEIWINFIMETTSTLLNKVTHAFFRDEYQEDSGNLPHIHGLVKLERGDLDNKEFFDFLGQLQKNSVGEIIPTTEIESFMKKGLLKNVEDWKEIHHQAKVLNHNCSNGRCIVRTGPGPNDWFCKNQHPVFASKDPLENELLPIPFEWDDDCKRVLSRAGLYTQRKEGEVSGTFHRPMFLPHKHVGPVLPSAREKQSPVFAEYFAFTRSSQNAQVVTGTNGVARYIAKVSLSIVPN